VTNHRWQDPDVAGRYRGEATPWNPTRPEQVDILFHLIRAAPPRRVLDAGCGPGDLSERLLAEYPGVELVAFDFSMTMVARARELLGDRARVLHMDLSGDWEAAGGDFDLVVAVQAVHHLADEAKRNAIAQAFASLRSGGRYLQSDPVAVRDDAFFRHHLMLWNRARREAGFDPLPEDYDHLRFSRQLRDYEDHLASLESHLEWLEEAGFEPVECIWRSGNRAIFGGLRP
jgi:tRNA (cmo5U34)-methyltransferase